MISIYADISNKIDPQLRVVIGDLVRVLDETQTEFFFVGARARDILFELIFGIAARAATNDVDVGLRVASWEEFQSVVGTLASYTRFHRSRTHGYRLIHESGMIVDVLPFGDIEVPKGKIQWPQSDRIMTMVGFEEAYKAAIAVRASDELTIRVCTAPGLVILKLIAWDEDRSRDNDAKDIAYIMMHYADAGQEDRIYGRDADLVEEDGFDYGNIGPRLLGRDIAQIASAESLAWILPLLERELGEKGGALAYAMMEHRFDVDRERAMQLDMINQLRLGILDGKHRTA
ncbi:MAG: hypothetical protein MUE68_07300 [Bacteroidetes bacterium]|jgi:predicted nucleotidyltransferase|nr:hypothetical protein [Bacteroidota bacterium]